jgi:hypothetical protein
VSRSSSRNTNGTSSALGAIRIAHSPSPFSFRLPCHNNEDPRFITFPSDFNAAVEPYCG